MARRDPGVRLTWQYVRFTLDHNCLIDLEEDRENAPHVREVALAARGGVHSICMPASAGAERLKDGTTAPSLTVLQGRLRAVGLDHADILNPLLRAGMSFIGFAVLSGPELERLEEDIRAILFPTMPHRLSSYADQVEAEDDRPRAAARWSNATLDVDAMWCHIHYGCDVFVTRDLNFLRPKKRAALIELGAKQIALPEDAARLVRGSGSG